MTDLPRFISDPAVKVYAAESFPVVWVAGGTPQVLRMLDGKPAHESVRWQPIAYLQDSPAADKLRTAWDRLRLDHPHEFRGSQDKTVPRDGFYFLRPELDKALKNDTGLIYVPPELVPCNQFPDTARVLYQLEKGDWSELIDPDYQPAALILHLPQRECEACAQGRRPTKKHLHLCHGTGTVPEQIHVEERAEK